MGKGVRAGIRIRMRDHDTNTDTQPHSDVLVEIYARHPFRPEPTILCEYAGVQLWSNCYLVRTETGAAVRPPTVHAHTPYELDCQANSIAAVRVNDMGKTELFLLECL